MFNGVVLRALSRLTLPGRFVFWLFYRRLVAKQRCERSNIDVLGLKPVDASTALAHGRFERVDTGDRVFEASTAVYRLQRLAGAWRIAEVWMSEDEAPPPGVDLRGFEPPARY